MTDGSILRSLTGIVRSGRLATCSSINASISNVAIILCLQMCYTFISLLLDLEVRSDGQLRYVLLALGKELYQWDEMSQHFRWQYTCIPLSVLGVKVVQ